MIAFEAGLMAIPYVGPFLRILFDLRSSSPKLFDGVGTIRDQAAVDSKYAYWVNGG